MKVLTRDQLPLGGFAGIKEHRMVTDSRLFGSRKRAEAFDGLGNFVYLADAKFNPQGQSGMHPHSEIDVISIVIDGRVSHEGSLEHGKDLVAGDVQVQRAGGEGFHHNEINPDNQQNRMLQVWALPETKGQPAGYKSYEPKQDGVTRIYGGDKNQNETFDSRTLIDVVNLKAGDTLSLDRESMLYVTGGEANVKDAQGVHDSVTAVDGHLIHGADLSVTAVKDVHMVVISEAA